ncbi:unnamed protein product [Mycetohabitans rhizoxinica HKI 454]|uniref:Uncharacterized protein n=1 Tax=Mycetohabitans rhizoxinica (strain DSM 19002 / CIP 109453 / HKI 454) TaxID=882378 RepID=E5AKW1_MYCRK|nr:unnamed protein product [Mycetohabitans rhizoxinica HKI 454]
MDMMLPRSECEAADDEQQVACIDAAQVRYEQTHHRSAPVSD